MDSIREQKYSPSIFPFTLSFGSLIGWSTLIFSLFFIMRSFLALIDSKNPISSERYYREAPPGPFTSDASDAYVRLNDVNSEL